jgi:hypothetical protein
LITAGSGSSASLNDQDGIPLNADTYSNTWHFRRAELSSLEVFLPFKQGILSSGTRLPYFSTFES